MTRDFPIINPATEETVRHHSGIDAREAMRRIDASNAAWGQWSGASLSDRGAVLLQAASILDEDRNRWATRITQEMGKPITESLAEVDKCAWVCRWYAQNTESLLADEHYDIDTADVRLVRRPLGVLYAIMPWNFPLWQVFRAAAPNLMAGNAMVLKHAPNVFGCAADITEIFQRASAPEGLFVDLPIDVADSPAVVAHRHVRGVTLTGSDHAGAAVAAQAGQHLKKCVLELGGSDPGVVLADADVDLAVDRCVASRMLNCGQVCIAIKRFIVVDDVYDQFRDGVLAKLEGIKMQSPLDPESALGPMARADLRDALHGQVCASIDAGARLVLGGHVPTQAGWWYPATMLEDVTPGMPAFDEEIFGPVACLVRARDIHDALELAADTRFGLAGSIFTSDRDRGEDIAANHMHAGCLAVNDFTRSDPRVPFGGIYDSGFGRELGAAGLHEFTNLKSVVVARA